MKCVLELGTSNEKLTLQTLQTLISAGVKEFCLCAGKRNSSFVKALSLLPQLITYHWYEERSAAFFALGRSRATNSPVAIITTSGTAVGELLPAAMEAYYTGVPLILVTTDRPRCYRGSGAPQAAEQVGIFGCYATYSQDVEGDELCDLTDWRRVGPAHLNVCLEEPAHYPFDGLETLEIDNSIVSVAMCDKLDSNEILNRWHQFSKSCSFPLVIVSALPESSREAAIAFLLKLKAPVYCEGTSGLRENPRLDHLRVSLLDKVWTHSRACNYPVDGVLRLGGVPTIRLWRDLEDKPGAVKVLSISDLPFSGISNGNHLFGDFEAILNIIGNSLEHQKTFPYQQWLEQDRRLWKDIDALIDQEPHAEQSLMHAFSKAIPDKSLVYLGNSLPIRMWDAFAAQQHHAFEVQGSRGLNGIDGQISTFLGLCSPERTNWAVIGDLTALYDLAGPWILSQLQGMKINIAIFNNGGGKIFDRMFSMKEMQNLHQIEFEPFARLWNLGYKRFETIPEHLEFDRNTVIEIVPCNEATSRFWKKMP